MKTLTLEQALEFGGNVSEIESLIKARNDARAGKDWAAADAARDALNALSVVLEDSATGTTWRRG